MTTKRHNKATIRATATVRARVQPPLKQRVTAYRLQPQVRRSEGFIVVDALTHYLDLHEPQLKGASK